MAADSEFTPVVHRLGCLRGIGTLTGFAFVVEIGDWHRFTGNSIGAFVGLVSSEHSSGASRVQGSITKTGNQHHVSEWLRLVSAPAPRLQRWTRRPVAAQTMRPQRPSEIATTTCSATQNR